ncbi:hypothetical protein [Methylibium sp.]|jgi:hypothetical protein|uniref:hypothetical protein n=1 Tax=Methylibium sp. TaxID=2067992 RepID=UPI003D13E42B
MFARSLAVVMLVAGLLGGCASSRHTEPGAAAANSLSQGNATVSRISYFAAWVDAPAAVAVPTAPAAAKPVPASKAKPAASGKRDKRTAPSASTARPETPAAPAAPVDAGPKPLPQPRYEYTVELDGGGVQTLVGHRDLGIRVNDRVLVQGGSVTALAN